MNVSYEWLRALVPFEASPRELRDLITAHTATVDELVALRADLAPIVVARVVESEQIPDTRLTANKVDAGTGELLEVVCGAPNVEVGKLYPFAPAGTTMPGGLKIERRKIRGAVSNGMLCSARELGLGQDHDGILTLDLDVAPGTPFLQAVPSGDSRLVVDVLANRPDLLSHRGLAREIAAVTGKPMALPVFQGDSGGIATPRRGTGSGETGGMKVQIDGTALVRRYMGIVIRGIKVGPSPDWLVARLEAVGSRSINNVVDATNYILWELGQPTHAFDAAKLEGNTVKVRPARPGETLVTLDGVERKLAPEMTVIADAMHAVAIAGVMGGRDSEVSEATTDIFLEVASFDPARTRATRRQLGLGTDASYRFERGVDPELTAEALDRCARLIIALAGGAIAGAPIDLYLQPYSPRSATLRMPRLAKVLGAVVPTDRAARLLRTVGCTVKPAGGEALEVTPPSWRPDLVEEIDLIEEVARLHGYDAFPSELRAGQPSATPDDPQWVTADRVREALVAAGLLEVRPLPFVAGTADGGYVRVSNPLADNEAYLRRDVLETLARRAEYNLAHMQRNVRIFEIGGTFAPSAGILPVEELRVGCLIMGDRDPAHFTSPRPAAFDEWDARWVAEVVARAAYPRAEVALRQAETADRLWDVTIDGAPLGTVRAVPLDAPVWAAPAYGVELSLGRVPSADVAPPGRHAHRDGGAAIHAATFSPFKPLPNTPASEFDLALLVRDDQKAADVEAVIRQAAGELLESLTLFDLYVGKGVPEGYRSLAWRLVLRHPERTLRDKEIEGRRAKILSTLKAELDVRPRAG